MQRVILGSLLLLAMSSAYAADPIDLSKPWGNKDGCINRVQQEVYSENMMLLKEDAIVTSASACEITGKTVNKDGSLSLTTMCESEGEEAPDPTPFTVVRTKKKGVLHILDRDGNLFGEVRLCR